MDLFGITKPVIGMLHTPASPGTPRYSGSLVDIFDRTIEECEVYAQHGVDILMIENMHDVPYLNRKSRPEVLALMAVLCYEVKLRTGLPLGLQILAGVNKDALAAAFVSGADFIRAEGFVFGHIGDEGYFDSDAGELLRYRKEIEADDIKIFTDIKKKHSSHAVTADVDLQETAHAAEFFLSDGLIVTGTSTGKAPLLDDIAAVRSATKLPVIAGSGVSTDNIEEFYPLCDAFIIGSHFKKDGFWGNPLDEQRIKTFMEKKNSLRQTE